MILNLTQHAPTEEQVEAGVIEPNNKEEVKRFLTFTSPPKRVEVVERALALTEIALQHNADAVMIGGAPYLMAPLEQMLLDRGIAPLYSFTERRATETTKPDGSVHKTQEFVHIGWVEV